ncbi:hypothetical protein J6590_040937 [Homalodisca vitripennis]|nr:hypothetical protein J6590_040937 [Homalodisca vitripennis]
MTEHEERQLIEECSRRPVLELLDTTYTDSLPTSSTDAAESFIFIQSEDSFKWMTSVDDLIKQCMAESRFRPRGSGTNIIDKIVLTGSWGLWKKLMYHISEYFGCKGTNARFASKSHDRTMVARGAALLVMYQECKVDFKLIELTSKLTVKNPKDIETVVIAAQTPIPIERTVYFVVGARCIENYVLFRVFEHPRNKSERSICLGGVSLIHPCSKLTICHVKVTFNIREDYRFIVTVTDEIHNLQREVVISEDTGDDITINHDNMSNINEISEEMYRKNLQLQNRFKTPAIPPTLPKSQSPTKKAEDKSKLPAVLMSADGENYLIEQGGVWRCDPSFKCDQRTCMWNRGVASLEGSLGTSLNSCHEEIAEENELIYKKREELAGLMKYLKAENATLRKHVSCLDTRLDKAEQYSRQNTLGIYGIAIEKGEYDHRLQVRDGSSRPPGIVVKMVRRVDDKGLLQNKRVKRNSTTWAYTHLWTRSGKIMTRKNLGDNVRIVSTMDDITTLLVDIHTDIQSVDWLQLTCHADNVDFVLLAVYRLLGAPIGQYFTDILQLISSYYGHHVVYTGDFNLNIKTECNVVDSYLGLMASYTA